MQNIDNIYGYNFTDMAVLKYSMQKLNAKKYVCVTDFSRGSF